MSDEGKIIWLYGRPCSGKTTLGTELISRLSEMGQSHFFIDADELRATVNNDLGFGIEDRHENIRRAIEFACFIAKQKKATVVCAIITPHNNLRELVKSVAEKYGLPLHMYFVKAPVEECARRDVKGHYKLVCEGVLKSFTGISSSFEEPDPDTPTLHTAEHSIDECVNKILADINKLCG